MIRHGVPSVDEVATVKTTAGRGSRQDVHTRKPTWEHLGGAKPDHMTPYEWFADAKDGKWGRVSFTIHKIDGGFDLVAAWSRTTSRGNWKAAGYQEYEGDTIASMKAKAETIMGHVRASNGE